MKDHVKTDIIRKIKDRRLKQGYTIVQFPCFIFLCGKEKKDNILTNRELTQKYLESEKMIRIALAEDVWREDYLKDTDLLSMEAFMLGTSDFIILFVESFGSASELSAFAYLLKKLNSKLTIILHKKFEKDKSFINHGPVQFARKHHATVIYTDWDKSLFAYNVRDRFDEIKRVSKQNSNKLRVNIKKGNNTLKPIEVIVFIFEIVKLFQPISKREILEIMKLLLEIQYYTLEKDIETDISNDIETRFFFDLLVKTNILIFDARDELYSISPDSMYIKVNALINLSIRDRNKLRIKLLLQRRKDGFYLNEIDNKRNV